MKNLTIAVLFVLVSILCFQCQKNPVDDKKDNAPTEQPDLLAMQKVDSGVPAAMDTLTGTDENTRTGGVYALIVRDIIFTNPLIGIPLVATAGTPVHHPQPGTWLWEKQIFQATHTLKAVWDGTDGYDWTYFWNGGAFDNYLALDGHTDLPGLNGNYTMYYNDADHSVYGTKIWSVDDSSNLMVSWVRAKYDPNNVHKREYLGHFNADHSGDLTFWENDFKGFHIEWAADGHGFWEIWTLAGNYLKGTF